MLFRSGEAVALLAGDGMFMDAFGVAAGNTRVSPEIRAEAVRLLSLATGSYGMVRGQIIDMFGETHRLSEDELLERTRAVAEVMPVIAFYLQTAVGGRVFTYDYWQKLCEIDNVVAIKAAPFNRYYSLDVVRAAALSSRADEITLYTGNDDNIVLDLITT